MNCSGKNSVKTIVTALCGASGALYGVRLLKALLESDNRVLLIVSDAGKQVLAHEQGYDGGSVHDFLESRGVKPLGQSSLTVHNENDFFSPPASGSFRHDGMVVCPCTMGTLSAVAGGSANNLIHRAADVCLKENLKLILVPRETPYNAIHLENMLKASRAGAVILPASPSFYGRPSTLDDLADTVVARILDHLGIAHGLVKPWGTP
jgi:4-hydroxy-3-polyprenylbenzoate decarboxylase